MEGRAPSEWRYWIGRAVWLYAVLLLLALGHWFERKFGSVEPAQVLFHLQQGSGGLLSADAGLVRSAIHNVLLAPMAAVALSGLLIGMIRWLSWPAVACWRRTLYQLERSRWAGRLRTLSLLGSLAWTAHACLAWPVEDVSGIDWFAQLYRPPEVTTVPLQRRNLVLVYAESLENSYGHAPFEPGLLKELELDGRPGVQAFGQFVQHAGTGWTMAGLVATQCGLPLKPLGIVGHNMLGEQAGHFLPGARCIGDVLADAGYRNVFLGGASLAFAGKGRFLQEHGYARVTGREEWLARNPQQAMNEWGLNDDALLDAALQEWGALQESGQPFLLTLLTVGMHPPSGFLSPRCEGQHHHMADAIRCTAKLLAAFLDTARQRGLLRDTDVVIVGDHLSMPNSLWPQLKQVPNRSIFNRIVADRRLVLQRASVNHFDWAPTLLNLMGFGLAQGRLGLGCTAIEPAKCQSVTSMDQIDAKLRAPSPAYERLWWSPALDGVAQTRVRQPS
jgi:phosphoglycerol transferase